MPGGRGVLVMQKRLAREEEDEAPQEEGAVEKYTGVKVKVSDAGRDGQPRCWERGKR